MSDDDPDEDLGDNYFLLFDDKEGLDEAESIISAVECLSPAVRELLISNPEAVEKAVEFVHAARSYKGLRNSSYAPFSPTGGRFKEAMDAAIDALSERQQPGRE